MLLIFVLVGVLVGLFLKPKAKDQVMKLIPRDMRFVDFDVKRENAFSVECEAKKGFPPQRFIKFKPGWTGQAGKFLKRTITRHLGLEGTAYTCQVGQGEKLAIKKPKKEEDSEEQKADNPGTEVATVENAVFLGSLGDCLKHIWGTEVYDEFPEEQRTKLEESKVNVIVGLEEITTPKGFKEITEEAIKQEEDRLAAETWWKGKKQAEKGAWMQWVFIFVAGMGAMAIASKLLGWW